MLDTSCFISLFKSDRIRKLFVYFSFLQILVLPVYCQTYEDARAVQEGLLNFYYNNNTKLISIIPVEDQSTALSVILTMHLYSVDGFNAVTGLVEISGSLYMEWKDETMVTSIGNYNFPFKEEGYSVRLPQESIFRPSIRLTNAVDSVKHVGDPAYKIRYHVYDGRMMWQPKVIMKAACKPDIEYYPFDRQKCSFVYTAWGFMTSEIILDSAQSEWYLCDYKPNAVWALLETTVESYEVDNQSYMRFLFTIERQPLYFVINVIFPILLLSFLTGFVFLLPVESGERIGYSLTCFLSFVFMLQTVMGFLPHTADPMSLFCFYVIIMMVISIVACILTVLSLKLHYKPETDKVPRCIQTFVRFLRCGPCKPIWRKCRKRCQRSTVDGLSVEGDLETANVHLRRVSESVQMVPFSTFKRNDSADGNLDSFLISSNEDPDEVISEHEDEMEEEMTWTDVAAVLDIFFFVVFLGGQITLSIFFLVPLMTGAS